MNEEGLTTNQASERLKKYGSNVLPEKSPPSDFSIFVSQLTSPLVYVLIGAGVVTLVLGHYTDTVIIFIAVFINTILGFFQERRANKALHELKKLIKLHATVIRNGEQVTVNVEEIVPGDICILNQGDKVPADGKIIDVNRLYLNEAILTGESLPVEKEIDEKAFMGTIVATGRGRMLVEVTGEETEIGKIALSIQETQEDTPLKHQLKIFSRKLMFLVVGLTAFVFVIGLLTGKELVEIFTTSVALAVSSIPEGLLVGLTVVLAIGMQRILKRKGLVRNLVSAETLGGVTTICVDKTGTLTAGNMRVVGVAGNKNDVILQSIVANDLDDPMLVEAYEWAIAGNSKKDHEKSKNKYKRIDSIPFSSKERFFASLNKWTHSAGSGQATNMVFVNGAPEYLLGWSNLTRSQKNEIKEKIDAYSREGKRLVGMARKEVPVANKKLNSKDVKSGLTWVGMLVFSDPIRAGVKSALKKTMTAGIKIIVITGDYANTAYAVMHELGMPVTPESVVVGTDLKKMTAETLSKKLKEGNLVSLFARTTPEQKLIIVESLKKNGEVVAMMGDGVNDAPALSRADIGIVVGDATDVAKESADLVLLDSSFDTIVAAIEEGRGIFDNIRKIILYLMSDAFMEIVAVVGSIFIGLYYSRNFPLPVTAVQILWINLVSDGFPHLALTVDPKRKNIMKLAPRKPNEQLVTTWMKRLIAIVSVTGGLIALALFVFYYATTRDVILSRSVAFATLGVNSLIYVYSIRMLGEPFWRSNMFENAWLNVAVLGGFILQITPFLFEGSRRFLGLAPLGVWEWGFIFSAGFIIFTIIEVLKGVLREHLTEA